MRKFYFLSLLFILQTAHAQTTVTIVSDRDNTVYSAFADNSNGAGEYFFVGKNAAANLSSVQRGLLHFNLSSIPAGAVITVATLTVYVSKSAPVATGIELHKLNADWGEGTSDASGNEASGVAATTNDATWSQRSFPSAKWAVAGGDFSSAVSASVQSIPSGIGSATAVTVTGQNTAADVQQWVSNSALNFGWIIKSTNETLEASVKRFVSRNSTAIAQRPLLSVTYTTALPVMLKSFSASLYKQDALLQWLTATEIDNDYFDVEHSSDGIHFTSVGHVKSNVTTTAEHAYTFVHYNITAGKHFYRLAENDKNGNVHYSPVISLSAAATLQLNLSPNPAGSYISLNASFLLNGSEFTVSSFSGQILKQGRITDQRIDVQQLAAGLYWLIIKTKNGEDLKANFFKK